MDDQLKLKIAASLDLPSDAAADPDVVNAVDVDPEAREFARGMHTLEAALRAWPSRARSDAQWERFASNIVAKLDEVAKVKSARTVSRDEADPAAAPVFEDETPSRMESKQAMSELQDNDNDLEALAALTRPSSVVPSIPPKPTAPSITDAIDDTSSGVVDIKQLAETAKKSAPPAEAPEADAKGEENGKSEAKPANGAKKSDVMSGVVDAVRTESVRAKSAHKDDVMVTPKRTTPAAEAPAPPRAARGGAVWGLVGGVAISALAFALYTNSQHTSPALQSTAPVTEGAPMASAPTPPPTPESTLSATTTPTAPPSAAPPAAPTESAADRGALAQGVAPADPSVGPPAPTTGAPSMEEQAEMRARMGSVGSVVAERESAQRDEAPAAVAANTHAEPARRAVVARAPAPAPTTAPAAPPPPAAQAAPARTTTATAAAPANAPAGGATVARANTTAPAARPGGGGTGSSSGASIDDLLTRAGGGDAPAMRTQAPAPAPAADLPERPTRSQVTSVLTPLNGAVRQCAGSQTGTAPVSITINSDGSVRTATVGGPFAGSSVGECIAGVVRRAHFQPFRAQQAQITWPFVILPQR